MGLLFANGLSLLPSLSDWPWPAGQSEQVGVPESFAQRDASFMIGPADARSMVQLPRPGLTPIEPTRIRQGRTATAGLLVVVVIAIVITAIAVFT